MRGRQHQKAWFAITKIILFTRFYLETELRIQLKGMVILGMRDEIHARGFFAFLKNE